MPKYIKAKQLYWDSPVSEFTEFYYGYYVEEFRTNQKHKYEIIPSIHLIANEGYHGTTLPIDIDTIEEVAIDVRRDCTGFYSPYCIEDDVFIFKGLAEKENT